MNKQQLRNLINATLVNIGHFSLDSVELLMGTAAQESYLGEYIQQLNHGPALGIFQMEPATFNDIVDNYLKYKPDLKKAIMDECNIKELVPSALRYNLKLAICFTRCHYLRKPGAIPISLEGQAAYWKKHYNTLKGKGTTEEYIYNYNRLAA